MHENARLGLLYLGRLEEEKGFGLILEVIKSYQGSALPFDLYVFGKGKYEKELLELGNQFPQIHFFGRKPLEEVQRYLSNVDYCLMPSLCLETFGLSAINVLQWGIPAIGFQKGGIKPFILDTYAIEKAKGKQEIQQLKSLIERLIEEKKSQNADFYHRLAEKCKALASNYSRERRFAQFQSMIFDFKCRKIVLVSDFINKIGGIETYMHDVKELLEAKGYQVLLWGSQCPSGFWGKVKKYVGLGMGAFNLRSAISFYFFTKREKPDLVWFHSMIRRNGRLPMRITRKLKAKKRMMYHDLGYFHPFPSKVYEEKQVKKLTFRNFLKMCQSKNPIVLLLASWKYLSLRLLNRQLEKQIDQHLVPSSFMEAMVKQALKVNRESIQTFEHFVQK